MQPLHLFIVFIHSHFVPNFMPTIYESLDNQKSKTRQTFSPVYHPLSKRLFPTPPIAKKILIQIEHANMQFGERLLWQDVNFDIKTAEFVALVGANGTGKTTLLQSVLGLLPLTKGNIITQPNVRIGYVPQLKDFDLKLPIRGRDLIQFGLDGQNLLFGYFDPKKTFGNYWITQKQKNYRIDKAIDEVGGKAFADAPLNMLSGGEQQRMRIAQALVSEPDVLLMDEPLLSLDVQSQQIVCDILAHRKLAHHTAVLMISHEIAPIVPLVDKVVLIAQQRATVGGQSLLPSMMAWG